MVGNITIIGTASGNGKFNTADQNLTPPEGAVLLGASDFASGNKLPGIVASGYAWGEGAQNGATTEIIGDAYRINYPTTTGGVYQWFELLFPDADVESDVYIQFQARFPLAARGGSKFCKVFSTHDVGDGYCNTTFGLTGDANDTVMSQISFGDGAGASNQNDVGNVINLDGTYPEWSGRSYGVTASISTPQNSVFGASEWGTTWHTFKIRCKWNSGHVGTEVADGAYYVEIDGDVYVNATGLFNSHPTNTKAIDYISFGNYAGGDQPPYSMEFKDIKISKGGFI